MRAPRGRSSSGFRINASFTGNLDINVLLGFAFGVLFLAVMLSFSIYFPNPTDSQLRIWIPALALSAAGVGAILPGFLEVRYKNLVRATGALGMFVLVYLFKPAIERNVPQFPEPTQDPTPIATKVLDRLDKGDILGVYNMFDPESDRRVVSFEKFRSLYKVAREPNGAAEHREPIQVQSQLNPSGAPPGRYLLLSYRTKFKNDCRIETVGLKANQKLSWTLWSYNIATQPTPCT